MGKVLVAGLNQLSGCQLQSGNDRFGPMTDFGPPAGADIAPITA